MRKFLVLFFLTAASLWANTMTLHSPAGGQTFYVGDTVYCKYDVDSEYIAIGKGVLFSISTEVNPSTGTNLWSDLHPIHNPDPTIYSVYFNDPDWGNVPMVIRDSVKYKVISQGLVTYKTVSTVSDSARFRIRDYSGDPLSIGDPVRIRPASEKPNAGVLEIPPQPKKPPPGKEPDSGCGKGFGLAFFPPLFFKIRSWKLSKKKGVR